MEVVFLSDKSVRIKGKQVTLTINPLDAKSKIPSDASLLIGKEKSTEFFSPESGVILQGPGEYEIKGTKITGFSKMPGDVMYTLHLDNINIFVGYVSSALLAKDTLHEHDAVVLFADDVLSPGVLGVLNANVFVFVGEKSAENAKAFDKELQTVGKYAITKDKLPVEKEFIFLA